MTDIPNWFQNDGLKNFEAHLQHLKDSSCRILQVGAYSGDASIWLYENILVHSKDSVLVDVDTWEGSDEPVHHGLNWGTVEEIYDLKTEEGQKSNKILKYKGTSDDFFRGNTELYDFIYIDGDHTAYGVIKDAVNSFEVLKPGGIIAFDDYQWSAGLGANKEPKMAIDSFLNIYADKINVIFKEYQCWVKKLK